MSFGIWNNLDELGLYMGLERLSYETDEEYSARIKQFAGYKYKTDYYTQVHSIPLQLGLETYEAMRLTCSYTDPLSGETTVLPFECKVEWEYVYFENFPPAGKENLKEYIRIFINNHDATVRKIMNTLDKTKTFRYTVLMGKYKRLPCKFLVRNSNVGIGRDFIQSKYSKLTHKNLIPGTLSTEAPGTCNREITSLLSLSKPGDYYIDIKEGYLQTQSDVNNGFYITYKYYKPYFSIEATELNLIPLNILAKYGITDQLAEYSKILLEDKVWGK